MSYHNDGGEELGHINSHSGEVDDVAHHLSELVDVLLHIGVSQKLHIKLPPKLAYSHQLVHLTSLLGLSSLLGGLSLLLSTGLLLAATSTDTGGSVAFMLLTSEHLS